jgi:hypothetical protein
MTGWKHDIFKNWCRDIPKVPWELLPYKLGPHRLVTIIDVTAETQSTKSYVTTHFHLGAILKLTLLDIFSLHPKI